MTIRRIVKMFEKGSVCVVGMRGAGKDMLIGNVIARRRKPYVSNVQYTKKGWYPLELDKLDCGQNSYKNFISGNLNYYEYPYPDGTDVYISDAGVYFPSQYCNELNKQYPYLATLGALIRHVGDAAIHTNTQQFGRCYDKLREQSDLFITAMGCKVLFGKSKFLPKWVPRLVVQRVRIHELAESCERRIPPYRGLPCLPLSRMWQEQKIRENEYYIAHGRIDEATIFYFNRSSYDTRMFKELLKNGKKT